MAWLGALSLTAFAFGQGPDSSVVGRFSLNVAPQSFDPIRAGDTVNQVLQRQVYEGLVEHDYRARPYDVQPLLAASWEVNEDQTEWIFELRKDAYFYDPFGITLWPSQRRPVQAQDVLFSWLRLNDSREPSNGDFVFQDVLAGINEFRAATRRSKESADAAMQSALKEGLEGIQVLGPSRLKIKLQRSTPDFLFRLASPYAVVYPREAVQLSGKDFLNKPIGSGPFVLRDWIPRYGAKFSKTPQWRGQEDPYGGSPLPHLEKLQFTYVAESSTRAQMFLNGELDRLPPARGFVDQWLPEQQLSEDLRKRGIRLIETPPTGTTMIYLNMEDPVIGLVPGDEAGNSKRRALRQAIALTFPYDRWNRTMRGKSKVVLSSNLLPPGYAESQRELKGPYFVEDKAEAHAKLAEAGYPQGDGMPEIVLDVYGNGAAQRRMGELIVNAYQEAGFNMVMQLNTGGEFVQKRDSGKIQMFLFAWYMDWPDTLSMFEILAGKNAVSGGINWSRFHHPEYDSLFEKYGQSDKGEDRLQIANRMLNILNEEVPVIPIDHLPGQLLLQPWLHNIEPHPYDFYAAKYYRIDRSGS